MDTAKTAGKHNRRGGGLRRVESCVGMPAARRKIIQASVSVTTVVGTVSLRSSRISVTTPSCCFRRR